jgi:serine/threonine protein phosphatase 1
MKNKIQRTFVLADIHGGYKALLQCLERSNFNYETDTLIQLGDVVDGWSEVYECVEELLKIKNLIAIRGNHDDWFRTWLKFDQHPISWNQGGYGTLNSYCKNLDKELWSVDRQGYLTDLLVMDIPNTHIEFFLKKQQPYYVDSENRLFVHGGFNRHFPITDEIYNNEDVLMWDRDLWLAALSYGTIDLTTRPRFKMHDKFSEVFIGHTTTINWKTDEPMQGANIWNLDTGCGFKGKLTIMDVDTKEYWQSDTVQELYNNEKGRN